jgi:SAM-dependent methyltransferase
MGIDIDPETIAIARSLSAGSADVEFRAAALTELAGTGYDVVTAITVVHHLELSVALTAMRRLTKPRGRLLIVGCYRSETASDYLIDVVTIGAKLLAGLLQSRHASLARITMSAHSGTYVHDRWRSQPKMPARASTGWPILSAPVCDRRGTLAGACTVWFSGSGVRACLDRFICGREAREVHLSKGVA